MKIMVVAIAFLLGGVAFGQEHSKSGKKSHEQHEQKSKSSATDRATRLTARLTKQLGLNAEQALKISEINLNIAAKNEGVRNNASYSKEQKKEILASNNEARKAMYKGIFTAEQYAQFEVLEKEREAKKAAHKAEQSGKKGKKVESTETEDHLEDDDL
jgi:protein CpxP